MIIYQGSNEPLLQTETATFPKGNLSVLAKWKNGDGQVEFADEIVYTVRAAIDLIYG